MRFGLVGSPVTRRVFWKPLPAEPAFGVAVVASRLVVKRTAPNTFPMK